MTAETKRNQLKKGDITILIPDGETFEILSFEWKGRRSLMVAFYYIIANLHQQRDNLSFPRKLLPTIYKNITSLQPSQFS